MFSRDKNRGSGCTVSIERGSQICVYDDGATSSKHHDFKQNMVFQYVILVCVESNELRGLNLFGNKSLR